MFVVQCRPPSVGRVSHCLGSAPAVWIPVLITCTLCLWCGAGRHLSVEPATVWVQCPLYGYLCWLLVPYVCGAVQAAICRSSQPLSGFSARCMDTCVDYLYLMFVVRCRPPSVGRASHCLGSAPAVWIPVLITCTLCLWCGAGRHLSVEPAAVWVQRPLYGYLCWLLVPYVCGAVQAAICRSSQPLSGFSARCMDTCVDYLYLMFVVRCRLPSVGRASRCPGSAPAVWIPVLITCTLCLWCGAGRHLSVEPATVRVQRPLYGYLCWLLVPYVCGAVQAAICRSSQPLSGFSARCMDTCVDYLYLMFVVRCRPPSVGRASRCPGSAPAVWIPVLITCTLCLWCGAGRHLSVEPAAVRVQCPLYGYLCWLLVPYVCGAVQAAICRSSQPLSGFSARCMDTCVDYLYLMFVVRCRPPSVGRASHCLGSAPAVWIPVLITCTLCLWCGAGRHLSVEPAAVRVQCPLYGYLCWLLVPYVCGAVQAAICRSSQPLSGFSARCMDTCVDYLYLMFVVRCRPPSVGRVSHCPGSVPAVWIPVLITCTLCLWCGAGRHLSVEPAAVRVQCPLYGYLCWLLVPYVCGAVQAAICRSSQPLSGFSARCMDTCVDYLYLMFVVRCRPPSVGRASRCPGSVPAVWIPVLITCTLCLWCGAGCHLSVESATVWVQCPLYGYLCWLLVPYVCGAVQAAICRSSQPLSGFSARCMDTCVDYLYLMFVVRCRPPSVGRASHCPGSAPAVWIPVLITCTLCLWCGAGRHLSVEPATVWVQRPLYGYLCWLLVPYVCGAVQAAICRSSQPLSGFSARCMDTCVDYLYLMFVVRCRLPSVGRASHCPGSAPAVWIPVLITCTLCLWCGAGRHLSVESATVRVQCPLYGYLCWLLVPYVCGAVQAAICRSSQPLSGFSARCMDTCVLCWLLVPYVCGAVQAAICRSSQPLSGFSARCMDTCVLCWLLVPYVCGAVQAAICRSSQPLSGFSARCMDTCVDYLYLMFVVRCRPPSVGRASHCPGSVPAVWIPVFCVDYLYLMFVVRCRLPSVGRASHCLGSAPAVWIPVLITCTLCLWCGAGCHLSVEPATVWVQRPLYGYLCWLLVPYVCGAVQAAICRSSQPLSGFSARCMDTCVLCWLLVPYVCGAVQAAICRSSQQLSGFSARCMDTCVDYLYLMFVVRCRPPSVGRVSRCPGSAPAVWIPVLITCTLCLWCGAGRHLSVEPATVRVQRPLYGYLCWLLVPYVCGAVQATICRSSQPLSGFSARCMDTCVDYLYLMFVVRCRPPSVGRASHCPGSVPAVWIPVLITCTLCLWCGAGHHLSVEPATVWVQRPLYGYLCWLLVPYVCGAVQAAICRSSQPLSGFSARCMEDEAMLQAILKANPKSKFMYVVDTRPKVSTPTSYYSRLTDFVDPSRW